MAYNTCYQLYSVLLHKHCLCKYASQCAAQKHCLHQPSECDFEGFLLRCFGCIDKFLRIRPIFGCIQKFFARHPKWFASTCFDSPFYWTVVRLYSYCKILLLHEGVQYAYICCDFADFSFYLYDCLGISSCSVLSA